MPVVDCLLAILIVLVVQSVVEWLVHKFLLHKLGGASKKSFFHYHWEHHHRCRTNGNIDSEYVDFFHGDLSKMCTKEVAFMILLSLFVSFPVYLFVWDVLGIVSFVGIWYYFFVHAYSHVNVEAGKIFLPWHFDHHMGLNQNLNWSITLPWADWVFRTRSENKPKASGSRS